MSERDRLRSLAAYRILDTQSEQVFDQIVALATSIFQAPIALMSLIDADRQWFKARIGIELSETPRNWAFCDHAIRSTQLFIVPDALADPRFIDNPLVVGEPGIRFYAGAVIRSADGHPLGTVCVIDRLPRTDLSPEQRDTLVALARLAEAELERRRTALDAQASAERVQDFVETSADWYWEMDEHLRFTDISGNVPDMPLQTDFIGRTRWEGHHGALESPKWQRHIADLDARLPFRDFEVDGRKTDGSPIHISISGKPFFDRSGKFLGYRGTSRDITARRAMELELARSEENFRAIFERHPDPMWTYEIGTLKFLIVNQAAVDLYGYSREEFTAMTILEIRPEEDRAEVMEFMSIAARGQPMQTEWRHRTRQGRTIDVLVRGRQTQFDGKPARLVQVQDITAIKAAREELARKDAQIRQANRLEAIGQLTGGVAHDFNNLLVVILGSAEQLAHSLREPHLRQLAEIIMNASERGADLTSRLLAFARRQALEPKAIDVPKLIADMDPLLRRTLGEDIDIRAAADRHLWKVLADASQLEGAVLNLCLNARDAMPAGGRLTIEMSNTEIESGGLYWDDDIQPGNYVMIAVSDTGCGMPPDVVARAFEPFFTTKEVGKGNGLGLSMVYGFVHQSGGHVRIYSEVGQGTSIRVYLPRVVDAGISVAEETGAGTPSAASPHGESILLVEDDDLVRSHVAMQLGHLGYEVMVAENGPRAIEILTGTGRIDLLLTDIVMPGGMTGRDVAEKALSLRPDLRVLFTSGYPREHITHQGRLDPGVQLLAKPYRSRELAAKVREVLDGPPFVGSTS